MTMISRSRGLTIRTIYSEQSLKSSLRDIGIASPTLRIKPQPPERGGNMEADPMVLTNNQNQHILTVQCQSHTQDKPPHRWYWHKDMSYGSNTRMELKLLAVKQPRFHGTSRSLSGLWSLKISGWSLGCRAIQLLKSFAVMVQLLPRQS